MENKIYNNLNKRFTSPKSKSISPFYNFKRIPRKLKKKVKLFCGVFYNSLSLNQRLWYYLEKQNINYKCFLIKQVYESELLKNVN